MTYIMVDKIILQGYICDIVYNKSTEENMEKIEKPFFKQEMEGA